MQGTQIRCLIITKKITTPPEPPNMPFMVVSIYSYNTSLQDYMMLTSEKTPDRILIIHL